MELMNRDIVANQIIMGVFCWFGIRLEFLSCIVMIAGCASCIFLRTEIDPVLLSLMLQYMLTLQTYCTNAMYFVGEIER